MVITTRLLLPVIATLFLAGCASYQQPRYGYDGVYYEQAVSHRSAPAVHVSPLIYPYWSLDYFYFSRYYHPYSVWVGAADPWFYPYPGWYYGYRPGTRTRISLAYGYGYYYPWFGYGYRGYQPWGWTYIHYPRYTSSPPTRVRHIDERLRMLETRQRDTRLATGPGTQALPTIGATSRQPSSRLSDEEGSRRLEREAVRERHSGAAASRATQTMPRRAGPPRQQPVIITSPQQRNDRSRQESTRQPVPARVQPDQRSGPARTQPREVLRSPPERQPRAQPQLPPARTQPATPPRTQPAPPPARPSPPPQSQPAERSRPARSRERQREREP